MQTTTMAHADSINFLVRHRACNGLPGKKCNSLSHTCTEKLLACDAMKVLETHVAATKMSLTAHVALEADEGAVGEEISELKNSPVGPTMSGFQSAKEMPNLDSALVDVPVEVEESAGFFVERQHIPTDTCIDDDECKDKTGFTKEETQTMLEFMEIDNAARLTWKRFSCARQGKCALVARCTHKDLADSESGGCGKALGLWLQLDGEAHGRQVFAVI